MMTPVPQDMQLRINIVMRYNKYGESEQRMENM